jgi:hypothetical protein
MKRRLFNLLTALSLLLCVGVVVFWVRGRSTIDVVAHRGQRLVQFVSGGGRVYVQWARFATRAGEGGPENVGPVRGVPPPPPPLTRYEETPGSYFEWAAQRDAVPWVPRSGPWDEEPSRGWHWTRTPGKVRGRPRIVDNVRDWLVDGWTESVPRAGTWDGGAAGARRLAREVRRLESVHFDPETGAARPWVEEQWLTGWTAWAPLWPIAAATAALPAARLATWLVRRHRSRRLSRQCRCPACGYDLRATPGRCPECGAEPPGLVMA